MAFTHQFSVRFLYGWLKINYRVIVDFIRIYSNFINGTYCTKHVRWTPATYQCTTTYSHRANLTTNQQAHQMKINHSQSILSPSKLHSISSLPLSAKDILSAETNVAYASTALIIANATNLNELQTNDNIFSDKLPIYKHLLSPSNIDTAEQCGKNVATVPSATLQSPIKYDLNNDHIKNLRNNSYCNETTATPTEPTNSFRSSGRRPPLSHQNRFLSLSISPPLTRRQDMPVLRGTFVSL